MKKIICTKGILSLKRILCPKRILPLLCAAAAVLLLNGCQVDSKERVKLRDLDFTVLSEEKIPEELAAIIEERKAEAFKLTYRDEEFLYIVIGYGRQSTGGYSIAVNSLYLTENAIYVSTNLLGPESAEKKEDAASYPYIVIKTEGLEETVIFE